MIKNMSKSLLSKLLILSILCCSCYQETNKKECTKKSNVNIDDLKNFTVVLDSLSLEKNIKKIQLWYDGLPQKILDKISSSSLIIELCYFNNSNSISKEEQVRLDNFIQSYIEFIHYMIGDINGYKIGILYPRIYPSFKKADYMTLSLKKISCNKLNFNN